MALVQYITIREFCDFHAVDIKLIEEIIDFGLLSPQEQNQQLCISEDEVDTLETMLRLHQELGINWAGVETILNMRESMQELQQQRRQLEQQLREFQQFFWVRTS